jgi:DNA-3-methyladenine glycosylase
VRLLPQGFYQRPALVVAVELLNKVIEVGGVTVRIVETEAYLGDGTDPASHSHRGPTPRNATMFGRPGRLYVYRSYGMHWCANVVTAPAGSAVLLRAGAPVAGLDSMRDRRPKARRDRDLASGPGKLCQALGITGDHDGADLRHSDVRISYDGLDPPVDLGNGLRVGISAAVERPWRWWVPGDPNVSRGPVSLRVDPDHDGLADPGLGA